MKKDMGVIFFYSFVVKLLNIVLNFVLWYIMKF